MAARDILSDIVVHLRVLRAACCVLRAGGAMGNTVATCPLEQCRAGEGATVGVSGP